MPGVWFDELSLGQRFEHPIRRTVTETDNLLFTTLSHNPAQLHLDAEYMRESEYGQVLVNSCFTLSLMVGVSVGDTLNIVTEVLELRESKSRPDAGIVTFLHQAWNQRGELVASCKRSGLQRKRLA